jgi:plasmid stability protein
MSKMVQIRNVPDPLHRELKSRAALAGKTLSDYLLAELRQVAARPTPAAMWERLRTREPTRLASDPADILRAERAGRE